ncbi:MAG: alpha-glucan family phosphorylase [Dehalococcoidia bacterium]|nr:alpha-glucan family phosphorylase [Dehalococcoidia bacterium]
MINGAQRLSLPQRIGRLDELAHNLWWTWHPLARELFRKLDYAIWRKTSHNPVKQLREVSPDRLIQAASDPAFLSLYDATMSAFDSELSTDNTWCVSECRGKITGPVALFSAEFAIHNSLPIYAGGLGILAGDICKEASDIGLPLVGVGLMYFRGYFCQRISAEGYQTEIYLPVNLEEAPIEPVFGSDGRRLMIEMSLDNLTALVSAWRIMVGRTTIYLLDTNIEGNPGEISQLSAQLYTSDQGMRIQQEMLLGIGGVRLLRALGIKPAVWHANEGHTAFMMLERIREELEKGASYEEASARVRASTVFTTHTPVPAGHDAFPIHLLQKYIHRYLDGSGINGDTFMELGRANGWDQHFNMTAFALKTAEQRNGVSKLHGMVSRRMWHVLWPQVKEEEVPISHITNGVHVPTWLAPEMQELYETYLGKDWLDRHDDPELWKKVESIPDKELWHVRQALKRKLLTTMADRARDALTEGNMALNQVLAAGALLDADVLTIGFVRRFAEYKRPAMIFQDIERLKRLINNPWKPVQIIFAGKSHPADGASKYLIQQVYALARDSGFQGRIAFVADYDMHISHFLVQGVDVWLNNPRRLQEACGTSGMKASVNGVPHLSILDGWWPEAYNGVNGWAIGTSPGKSFDENETEDADSLYRLLEEKVVPLYYERDANGLPSGWLTVVKEAIRSVVPAFSSRRMLKEYTRQMYIKALPQTNSPTPLTQQ